MTYKNANNKNIGSSETLRAVCSEKISNINTKAENAYKSKRNFSHWLAGVIDGDGSLLVSKNGYASCEITCALHERQILQLIKCQLGGSIKKRRKVQALRWRLHNAKGMRLLVNTINGKLLVPARVSQLEKVCNSLKLSAERGQFSCDNSWLAGFYEAQGYFNVNSTSLQCTITCSQKSPFLLREITGHLGGSVFYDKSWDGWLVGASSLGDISRWVNYFGKFPLISWKQIQLRRFKRIILYKGRGVHLQKEGPSWKRFQRLVNEFREQKDIVQRDLSPPIVFPARGEL